MLQMKLKQLQAKQKGFTLLELLVVITLLAVLSVGALVAYEGIGDNAQATAAANNTAGADRAIRNYRAVTQSYPNQWDNLVTSTGATPDFLADTTKEKFAVMAAPTGAFATAFYDAIEGVGIEELQTRLIQASTPGVDPNLQHNEGALGANALTDVKEDDIDNFGFLSILPTYGAGNCSFGGVALAGTARLDGTALSAADGQRQNVINDALESTQCNLVLALGFGHDAAHSTNNSTVAISTAPTYVSKTINPAKNYARYIALFHMGADTGGTADDVEVNELFAKPRLLAVVDTEGKMIDESIAKQTP